MSTVGIRELKNRLTYYLRRTKKGEEVIVTERGKPIALIQPIHSAEQVGTLEARLAKVAAQGFLTLPTRLPLKKVHQAKISGVALSRMILEDRR